MGRTAQEVFAAHESALTAGDVPRVLEDFTDDAVLITADGVFEGRAAVGQWYTAALAALPDVVFTFNSKAFAADALLLNWSASSLKGRIDDGVDTFVFADGRIRLQTISLHMQPA